ncbi:hypothetical protein JCM3766R1_004769 [Sporobolomyces carnicolor]
MPLALLQAVGTDLSSLRPPARRRSVSFGANEVEEFNGSEAPDAIEPAPSRQGARTPVPPSNGMLVRAVPIERPASRGYDRESYVRDSPATRAMPPPPVPSTTQRVPSRAHLRESRVPGYPQASIERTQSYGSPHFAYDDGGDDGDLPAEDDDDDAFTALADSTVVADSTAGTGVASDLSFDYDPNPRRTSSGENGRPSFPSMRDSPNTAQMYRPSYTRASASGFDHTNFAHPEPAEAPAFSSATAGRDAGIGSKLGRLAPPPSIERPRSTGSLREPMRLDEDSYAGGISRGRTPTNRIASSYSRATEDSPIEKELIALLKELHFSLALKDFHDTMRIGVERTLVAEDGMGHAYCKVHCKRLPRHEEISKQRHLRKHWVPIAGSRWEFRTPSHSVTVVFKTAALAAYEAQFTTSRRA